MLEGHPTAVSTKDYHQRAMTHSKILPSPSNVPVMQDVQAEQCSACAYASMATLCSGTNSHKQRSPSSSPSLNIFL